MQQQHELDEHIEQFLQSLNGGESAGHETDIPQEEPSRPSPEQERDEEIEETIHVYFVREPTAPQKDERIIESTPPRKSQSKSDLPTYTTILFFLFLIFSCLAFQLYLVFNPPIVTVTVVPRSQAVSLTGTLQLGRVVSPITLSQSQSVPTTGKGHQDPRAATGSLTLFNGQLSIVTVQAGTVITSASGIPIVTDQDAAIPPADLTANPPIFGQVTISSHATNVGTAGNIAAYAINQPCCSASVIAKNMTPFTGGQDKRNFQTVSKADISRVATPLKTTVMQSMSAALQGQVNPDEQLALLPCRPTVTSDHPIGAEATQVKITVSETCRAVAYTREAVERKATDLLNRQAVQKLGTGYSLFGNVRVRVKGATDTHTPPLVFISFAATGTWVYALNHREQQQIKELIAGKTKQDALHELLSLPGVERATISWGDDTQLPKNSRYIHFIILINSV